jgi:hypothetical protein
MKTAIATLMSAIGFAGSVAAGPFEAAVAAYEKGVATHETGVAAHHLSVYATALRLLRQADINSHRSGIGADEPERGSEPTLHRAALRRRKLWSSRFDARSACRRNRI